MSAAHSRVPYGIVLLAIVLGTACSSPTSPSIQPKIKNTPDDFEYQVSNVRNFSGSTASTWQNTGTMATVNQTTTLTAGGVSLAIQDATGAQVYFQSLADKGTFPTAAGVTGPWKITVVYVDASGSVNFQVQKAP